MIRYLIILFLLIATTCKGQDTVRIPFAVANRVLFDLDRLDILDSLSSSQTSHIKSLDIAIDSLQKSLEDKDSIEVKWKEVHAKDSIEAITVKDGCNIQVKEAKAKGRKQGGLAVGIAAILLLILIH